jgi:hypothetical protein
MPSNAGNAVVAGTAGNDELDHLSHEMAKQNSQGFSPGFVNERFDLKVSTEFGPVGRGVY